ncbi:MAG: tandem-95 repeat protein, partial [Planctomycetota bacterium]|nr:tandem-95 repeat protein [Planctomycetota bacterium]
MNKYKLQQWFKSLFDFESLSNSKHPRSDRLSVELLEIRLTPDANTMPGFHDLGNDISDNNCPANSITLIDDIRLLQNLTDYRANQVYFSSNNSSDFPALMFQSVNKLDAVALQAATTKGVVIIDSALVATIPADELKGSLVISIDSNRDVVSQITTALEGLSDVPVLRIISHGDDGVLYFGNQAFDSTALTSSAMQVASWGKSLTPDADILLYGCSIANTDAGKAFVQQFASITQADIAASSNLTGKGGDEVLEFQVGQVSNSLIASAIDYYSANLTLAQITVTTTADSGAGSLRQAITDANSTSANDEIVFASSLFTNGVSTITLGSGALPTIAATTSAGSLTLTGPGASALVINGNNGNGSRNFSIFNIASGGNLSISGVTVSGAKTTGNGAGFSNLGTLTVTNSLISGNSGGNVGGGIYTRGTLTVSGSTFTGNSANYGGGLYISKWSSFGTVSNSTFSGNTGFRQGGGLFNNGTLTITNTTVSGNTSPGAGGLHSNGTIYIANTIIANSTNGVDYYGTANLISPATASSNLVTQSGLAWATTVTSAQLNLGPLQNNGGPTSTMALGAGSVAIGAGNATVSNASPVNGLDQRGITRSTTSPSIGAYEYLPSISFSPQTTLATWNKAGKVITVDVNNDGKKDIVVQNIGYGEPNNGPRHDFVYVFLGRGDGTFETRIDTATGSYSNWLGSGDFNGDGKVDFVTPNYCGESITILLGMGDGTFNRQDMSNAGGTTSPSFVTTGDVNGDGKIDILTTNQNSSNVSVFLGNGNGTFQVPTLLSTSAIPSRIVAGDFNSDGKLDIVVHTAPGNVPANTLFLGTGTGSFTSNSIIGITGELTVADFNRDGFADIAGTEPNAVKVLLSNGNATFKAAQTFSAPNVGASIIATDLNGDGFLDLQLPQFYANTLAVLNGNGDGSFKAQVNFAVGSNPFTVASADFNSDGKPDIVVSNLNSKNVSVLLNTSNYAPTLAAISVSGTEDNAVTFSAANFTGGTVASPGIAYVGLQADMGAGWRTASTPKTYDIDGNNVLGSNGWWLPNYTLSSPSYITSFANNSYYPGNGGYALVDNPLTTPGASPSLIYSGTTNGQFPGYGIKSINSVVSFTLTGVVPGTIRVGIMTGNTDVSGAFGASGYQIISAPFDSGMTTELQTNGAVYNGNPDWVFFDITGGIAGQTYSIYAKGGPQGNAGIGAISFDSITVTPTYSDAENNPLVSITIATLPATGTLKLSGADVSTGQVIAAANLGNLTYVPALNENGIKTFTVTASDGAASSSPETTVSMNIAAVNDAPTLSPSRVVVATASASVNANSEVSFSETQSIPPGVTVSGVKVTRDFSTYWPSSNPAYAHVYLKLNGVVVGQLGFNATGTNGAYTSVSTEFFGPLASYIPGGINTWTIGSLWNPVNLANIKIQLFYADASAPAIAVNGTEDTPLNFTAANFTNAYGDAENNSLATITIATLPATGTLILSGANVSPGQVISAANLGNLSYVPAPNENGAKTFTVTASDGNSSSAVATVSMNIAAVSDAPSIGGISTSINYISTDFTTAPANATISGSAVVSNGECVLTPAASGQYGYLLFNTLASNPTAFSAQFDYRVADGSGADGTSFNYGVIGSPSGDESGMTNTGLVVSLIEYGTQRVQIKLNGTVLQTANVTLIGSNYQRIVVNIDGSNKLSVSVGGVAVVSNLDLGATYGNADKSTWKFGFASRCGGANNKHSIDNLVISNNVAPVTALEQTPTVLAGSLTLSDVDNSTLASAIVTIATGLKTSEDVLGFVAHATNYGNITGTYNSSTGALSLISAGATATLAQWQAALRSVTYVNTSDAPDTTTRAVSFVVNDGTVNSAVATLTVNVTSVNDVPVAIADVYTTTEDTPLVVSLGSPVVDQQQTAWNAGLPYGGYQTFTAGQTGFLTSIDLMQNGGASNPQQVTLTIYAGDGISGVALGEVTISETNSGDFIQTYTFSQPVAIVSGGVYTFKVLSSSIRGLVGSSNTNAYVNGRFYQSGGYTGDLWFRTSVATSQGLLVNDSDVESNSLTAVIVTNPSNGTLVLNSDGKFTYTPNANFYGTDTFTYKASDGLSFSNVATVTVNVTAVNDVPVANGQLISPTEDTTYSGTLTGSDIESSSLTYSVVTQGTKGVVTITNAATGAFTYVPNANANGSDSFTFKVNDGSLDSAPATVTVSISAVNDAPVANGSATLPSINEDYVPVSYNAYDSFVSGPAAQSASNRWQYFGGTTSSLTLLPNWKTDGNEVITSFPQWHQNLSSKGQYPFVQQITSAYGPVSAGTLVIHPADGGSSVSGAVSIGWKNTSSNTVFVDFGLTLRLPYGSSNGIEYFLQRGLVGTARYQSLNSGTITQSNSPVGISSSAPTELQPGEFIYLVVDSRVSYAWDHTEVSNFTVTENANRGATVASLFGANFSDSLDNSANTFAGVAVSSYTVDSAKGNWQYSSNGSTWSNLVSATSSAAITLKATDYLRFVPAANYNGQATALSANLIETGGAAITSGATVNLSGTGSQLVLGSSNVIGWSSVYSGAFAAD